MKVVLSLIFCLVVQSEAHIRGPNHGQRMQYTEGPIVQKKEVTKGIDDLIRIDIATSPKILDVNKDEIELLEGDIVPRKETKNTIVEPTAFWPTRNIPVEYSSDISLLAKAAIDEARREYELRTCFTFPQRTNETDYLYFQPLSGCWSYVGLTGGMQNVSIGRGCEQMATIIHEMMHAIGVWHEQSRADRDDYVDIMWQAITPGQLHNFFKYNYNDTDNRRVAYDFNSVMHYDKTAFTSNGDTTIQTRDPAFEDVIGQRSTFSAGDGNKISRMYNCSDTVRISYSVNFEEENAGGYSEYNLDSDVQWFRHNVPTSDTSGATTRFLPNFDSTLGIQGRGSFMYFDTSIKYPGFVGSIKSMRYRSTVARQCLEFSYFMDVAPNSQASFSVYVATINQNTGVITSYGAPIATFSGSYGLYWQVHRMTISAPSAYRIVFSAKTGGYTSDVIAIDDVSVVDRECDTGYFRVPHYSEILNTYEMGDYFTSPVLYTGTPGYAYQILVYPVGPSNGAEGYMGIYFRLVSGIYDDDLEWPFDKQFIRFLITDQGPNPLTRMNYYYNFLTNSILPGNPWNKPEANSTNAAYGYSTFMNNDKFSTRYYLKNDVAYFSVQVTDMRPYANGNTEMSAKMSNPILRTAVDDRMQDPEPEFMEKLPNPEDDIEDEHDDDGMITVGAAVIIALISSLSVVMVMSVVICCVAATEGKKLRNFPIIIATGSVSSDGSNIRYTDLQDKI